MIPPFPDLSDPVWTTKMVALLVEVMTNIARLDARISVSPVALAWQKRTSWSGYARALQAQGLEIEEIDIFAHACGIPLPSRTPIPTLTDPFARLSDWQARFATNGPRHWTDGLPFTFDPPEGWADRPALLRALELQGRWARAVPTQAPWLELPLLLQRLNATDTVLPCLVVGDKAMRLPPRDRDQITVRSLKALAAAAQDGLSLLTALERWRFQAAQKLAGEFRPGKLEGLLRLLLQSPVISPTRAADAMGVTLSGAGKLLERAVSLGLCHEVSGRHNWRLYLTPDLAVRFGFTAAPRGRPPALPAPSSSLDSILAAFDADVAEFALSMGKAPASRPADFNQA